MSYRKTYREQLQNLHYRRARHRSGGYMLTAALLMFMLFLPMEYLECRAYSMDETGRDSQAADTCCPPSEPHSDDAKECDDSASAGDNASHHDDCMSCISCDCYFAPFPGRNDMAGQDATIQNVSKDLQAPQNEVLFAIVHRTATALEMPADSHVQRPAPIYLVNQVFLN